MYMMSLFYRRNKPTAILPSSARFNMTLMKLRRELTSLNLRSTSYVPRAVMWGQRFVPGTNIHMYYKCICTKNMPVYNMITFCEGT